MAVTTVPDAAAGAARPTSGTTSSSTKIGDVHWRANTVVEGRVRTMRILPSAGSPTLELTVYDETGGITAVFTGRTSLPGVALGSHVEVSGRAGIRRGYLAFLNPGIRILAGNAAKLAHS